jgi:hypothetical protein
MQFKDIATIETSEIDLQHANLIDRSSLHP